MRKLLNPHLNRDQQICDSSSQSENVWHPLSLREAGVGILDCVHKTPVAIATGYPYVAIPQIKHGRLDLAEVRRISEEDFKEWTRKAKPQEFDVILSRRCNPGETANVPNGLECALGQNLVLLRADGLKVFPPFLRWLVRGPEWWEQIATFLNVGAVFDSLKCADIPNFRLTIPPLPEQLRIANILGSLEEKIELNRRMADTLELMARRVFKSWFVDFDPIHAKATARREHPDWPNDRVSRDALPKLNPKIAESFPDGFEHSAFERIPKGWGTRPLYDVAEFVNGAAFKNSDFCDPNLGRPVVKIAELKSGIAEQTKYSQKSVGPRREINCGDLLYSWSGSPDTSLDTFRWTGGKGLLNQHIFKVVTNDRSDKVFTYYLLKYLRPVLIETARNKQTTGLGHVTVADMRRLHVTSPSPEILLHFEKTVGGIYDLSFDLEVESATLATIRDKLLPKLLSEGVPTC